MRKTIYETERGSYNRTGWKNLKKRMRKMGLKSGEWHTLSRDCLTLDSVRKGMFIKNKSGGPLYRVIKVGNREITVIDVNDLAKAYPSRYFDTKKKLALFQWVSG